jgi:molecular chaperone DnaK
MNISAKDKSTGKENKITIKSDSGLSKEEIERMVQEAADNAESDKKRKELVETRNSGEAQLNNIRNEITDVEAELTDEQKERFNKILAEVSEVLKGEDQEAMTKKLTDTFTIAGEIAEAKGKKEAANAQPESPSDPNVVDAEATEVK